MGTYARALAMLALVGAAFVAGVSYSRSTNVTGQTAPAIPSAAYAVGVGEDLRLDDTHGPAAPMPAGTIRVAPDKQQLIGVRLGQVESGPTTSMRRLLGRVAADENRLYRVNVAMDSWIQEIFPVTVGSVVEKNQPLLSFYSPEFLGPIQAYFYALAAWDRYRESGQETPAQIVLAKASIQQAVDSLRNLGMGHEQLEELRRTRQLTQRIRLTSPAAGLVIARNASPGQRLERGAELYRIADLRHVWIVVDVFEDDAAHVRPGATAAVFLTQQRRSLPARVSDVLPQFDPVSRSLKVRLEAENPGYTLRPDMFVDVDVPVQLPSAVTVPVDAIIDSGLQRAVFVDRGDGLFERRQVETGWRIDDRVEILRGLVAGERIVVSGTFLLDSESLMRLARSGSSVVPTPSGRQHAESAAPPPFTRDAHEVGHGAHRHD
jgi:RND family efflux transporter MFP subunit